MEFKGRFVDVWKSSGKAKPVGSSPVLRPDETFLAAFVHPITPKYFLSDYFARKCAVFRGTAASAASFVDSFAAGGDVEELASATASDAVHCWLRTSAGAIETVRVPAGSDAMVLHRAGASLYFRAPKTFESAFVPAAADGIGLARGGYYDSAQAEQRGEVETFVSRAGHVTDWHWDFQHNFTLQLSGRKVWRVKWGGVPCAVRGATPHYKTAPDVIEMQLKSHRCASASDAAGTAASASAGAAGSAGKSTSSASASSASASSSAHIPSGPSFDFSPPPSFFDDAETVELRPGDRFHFPPGMWHRVECEEDSLSMNISLVGQSWGDVMAAATRNLLHRTAAGRGLASALVAGATASADAGTNTSADSAAAAAAAARPASGSPAGSSLSAMHSHIASMLSGLQASLAQLRPGHLMPPVAMLSRRFSRLHGAGAPAESESDGESDDGDDEDDGSDGSGSGSSSSTSSRAASAGPGDTLSAEVLAAHGLGEDGDGPLFRVWLHKGGPVITLGDLDEDIGRSQAAKAKGTAAATGAAKSGKAKDTSAPSLSLNPVAVIIHGDDVVRPKEAATQAAAAEASKHESHGTASGGVGAKRARAGATSAVVTAARSGSAAVRGAGKAKAKRARKAGDAEADSEDDSDNGDGSDDGGGDEDDVSASYLPPSPPRFDSWIVNINWGDDPETLASQVRAVVQTPRNMRPLMRSLISGMTATAPSLGEGAAAASSAGAGSVSSAVPPLPQALERALVFLGVLA